MGDSFLGSKAARAEVKVMDICVDSSICLQVMLIKYRDTFASTSYVLENSTRGLLKY